MAINYSWHSSVVKLIHYGWVGHLYLRCCEDMANHGMGSLWSQNASQGTKQKGNIWNGLKITLSTFWTPQNDRYWTLTKYSHSQALHHKKKKIAQNISTFIDALQLTTWMGAIQTRYFTFFCRWNPHGNDTWMKWYGHIVMNERELQAMRKQNRKMMQKSSHADLESK